MPLLVAIETPVYNLDIFSRNQAPSAELLVLLLGTFNEFNLNCRLYFLQAAKVPIKQQRCSEHVHFALEFDGLDFCDFLVRDLEAASSSRRPSTHPSSPVVSSH